MDRSTIRVLQIGMHDQIGGVETYLMNYYRNIDRNKIQFDFINPYDKLCFEDEIKKLGGKIYKVTNFKRHPFAFYKQLKKIMNENKYKIVHINMLSAANILPIMVAKSSNVKHIIVHSHNSNTPSGILRKILDKLNKKYLLKNATDFFACSDLAGKWLFGNEKKFTIINNAIDISKFKENHTIRNKIRKELKLEDKVVLGHVGRFSYQKNHDFLIDIFNDVQKKNENTVLLLIGTGELEENIREKVKRLNLEKKVIFLGTTDKVNEYLQAMDIFLLPSRFEGLPVVGIEAQSTNLKCFFSKNITEEAKIIEITEFLPINNYETWGNYIIQYINNPQKRKTSKSLEKYDIKKEAKRLENLYIDFYNGRGK